MNRIQQRLDALASSDQKALVSYVVAGDPDHEATLAVMHSLVDAGTDILELGVPFSDPSAEGPVIQLAHERALATKTGMRQVLSIVARFRTTDQQTPVVLMGYANPIEWMGYSEFCKAAVEAGVDGVLIVDIPPEEARDINAALKNHGLYNVFLIAPTTTDKRIKEICDFASGFLYYVSLKGVTGSGALDIKSVEAKVADIRKYTKLPICVGFGIKNVESAAAVSQVANGVVVGSAFVDLLSSSPTVNQGIEAVSVLAKDMKDAIS